MKKINPEQMYSALEAQKFSGIKARQDVIQHIKDGTLSAIIIGEGKPGGGTRYAIKGEWIISFIDRQKKGLIKGERYSIQELKNVLTGTLDYCEKNNIKTLDELTKSLSQLK